MFARLAAAQRPKRWAQPDGERIQSDSPAGTSEAGISMRSPGPNASP